MKGFSLIEIIVTLTLMLLLFGGAIANYTRYTDVQKLKQAALTLKNNLRMAQNKAQVGEKPPGIACTQLVGYEVSFTKYSYSYQAVCKPSAVGAPKTSFDLPNNVIFNPLPTKSMVFGVLTRGVNIASTTTLTLTSGKSKYELSIDPKGEITIATRAGVLK